jgi:hypothetical protein
MRDAIEEERVGMLPLEKLEHGGPAEVGDPNHGFRAAVFVPGAWISRSIVETARTRSASLVDTSRALAGSTYS